LVSLTSKKKNAILYAVDKGVAQTKKVRQKLILTIKEKIKDREVWIGAVKRVLCTLSFVVLCLLDQIVGSATGIYQQAMRDYTLVAVGVIILCAYRPEDFLKIPYLAWCVVFFTLKPFAFSWIRSNIGYLPELESMSWVIWIFGIVYIRMFYQYVIEKKKPEMNWPLFGVWMAMMICMVFSQFVSGNEEEWPLRFLFAFGTFYLTNYSRKDLNALFTCLVDGVMIGFFIVQGQAWMHRPYDMIRYEGMYSNCNMNALFYLVVLCAVLCKWYQAKLKKKTYVIRVVYILFAGLLVGHMLLTMSRTAVGVAGVVSILFLIFQVMSRRRHRIREFVIDGVALALAAVLCFVPSYYMVRYIPAYVNDPVFFEGDDNAYSMLMKVQKDDPIDSEKYVELGDAVKGFFGRLLWFVDFASNEVSRLFRPSMVVYAAEEDFGSDGEAYIEPGSDREHPVLTVEEGYSSSFKVRASIYMFYLKNLNLLGHSRNDRTVWITKDYNPPHAHNLFLQIAFDFGVLVGVLFIFLVGSAYYTVVRKAMAERYGACYYMLMVLSYFTTAFVLFGMLEIDWTYGQTAFSLFYVVQYLVYHKWGSGRLGEKPVAEKKRM